MPTGIAIVLAGRIPSIAVDFGGIGGGEVTASEDEAGAEDKIGGGLLAAGAATGAEEGIAAGEMTAAGETTGAGGSIVL